MAPRVSWVGLGIIGKGCTKRLIEHGDFEKPFLLWNRTKDKAYDHVAQFPLGTVEVVDGVDEVVSKADIIFSCLSDDAAVLEMYRGVRDRCDVRGKLFISCETVLAETTDEVQNCRRNAANIVVMSKGAIVEQGTHYMLLERQGAYYKLVTAQNIAVVDRLPTDDIAVSSEEGTHVQFISRKHHDKGCIVDEKDKVAARLYHPMTEASAWSRTPQRQNPDGDRKHNLWTLMKLIASFNKPEWKQAVIGCLFSAICGCGYPASAVFFSKIIAAMIIPVTSTSKPQIRINVSFWSAMYLMLAWVQFFAFVIKGVAFAICSERLVHRVRDRAFRSILRQDIAFFDKEENSRGALTSFLSTTTTHVAGLSGVTLGTVLMLNMTLVSASVLALAIGWKLAPVCIATIPILVACGFLRFWMLAHFQRRSNKAYVVSSRYASEAIGAIRTVASLTRERDVLSQYGTSLADQRRAGLISVAK